MKIKTLFSVISLIVIPVLFFSCGQTKKQDKKIATVRIGWQIPLATQGQIVQVLKKTDLLEKHGLRGDFKSFSYGGPQCEAALAGELDVIFVGDQPVVNLISRGGKWKVASRLFYTKTAIMVAPKSDITKMEQFKGKIIASPFGSVAHREAILKEQATGLNADKDVNNINLDILEISNVVQAGGEKSWGKIDGVAVWEPSTSLFERNNLARIVDYTITLGVVAISDEFMEKHPEAATQFLVALIKAWAYFATHQEQANKWYIDDARLSYKPEILKAASSIEPNINAKTVKDIDLSLTSGHIKTLEIAAQWSFERGFTKALANMPQAVNQAFLGKAIAIVEKEGFDVNAVEVR
jgi:sulfonate transport system substrate-binding protein